MSDFTEYLRGKNGFVSLKGVSAHDIEKAEKQLKTTFSAEYRDYLLTFGLAAWDGVELTGLCKSKSSNVVACTLYYREKNKVVPSDYYVIQVLGIDGIVIWQSPEGILYETINQSVPKKIAGSIMEYIKGNEDRKDSRWNL